MTAAGMFEAADLVFQADPHAYRLPDGRPVPSVTQILQAVGVSRDFESLGAFSLRLADRIEEKRALGSVVHIDCHAFDDDDLDWPSVDDRVLPYIEAWSVFREHARLIPVVRERRVFHATRFYCGTLDGLFRNDSGKRILIDIKTGDPADAAAHIQTAAYEAAYLAEHLDEAIDERWSVRLCPEKTVPYDIVNYSRRPDAYLDWGRFQACLTVFSEQPAQRRSSR